MRFGKIFTAILLGGALVGFSGCNQPTGSQTSDDATEQTGDVAAGDDHATDHQSAEMDSETTAANDPMAKMKEGLAELSPEDQTLAMKQHVCPVSGEMLGTMGAPKKIDVNGQPVWICCESCKDRLLAEPEKYLAKLNQE